MTSQQAVAQVVFENGGIELEQDDYEEVLEYFHPRSPNDSS